MTELQKSGERIERELPGTPVVVQDRTIVPFARMQGRIWRGPAKPPPDGVTASFAAGYVSVTPLHAVVTNARGEEQTVVITDVTGQALRGIGFAMLGVAGLCLYLMTMRKLLR